MTADLPQPIVDAMVQRGRDPFRVLVATLLSLRTKDQVTDQAASRLFARAATPSSLLSLSQDEIASLIYPVGFYTTKAATIHCVCRDLLDRFGGQVPADETALLSLKGVGRKTANLVLSAGFGVDAICVDTHVHRISNRWGYVTTRTPEETETALRRRLPRRHWRVINGLLVAFGQNLCAPVSPWCSRCTLASWWCRRVGVGRSR